ncbi:hypothetical protein QE152_g12430 [Popillia japonica]|uniref:Reverse transcriptase n=1 Tax=Popillia japonica TaxID=7064 RepID=A0AAW1LRU5_POPJA
MKDHRLKLAPDKTYVLLMKGKRRRDIVFSLDGLLNEGNRTNQVYGPSSDRRVVLCSAIHNLLLYGALVWRKVIEIDKYRRMLEKAERGMLMRFRPIERYSWRHYR